MRVSVVVCEHTPDRFGDLRDAVESVLSQSHDDTELVLVADGSPEVYDRVRSEYGDHENLVVHLSDQNHGLLESRNTGAELAGGDIVAFLDDDAIADRRWIEELVETYDRTDAIAAGGKMVPEWVAGKPSFLPEEFYWLIGVTHRGFADGPGEVRNTFGSNISFRRDVFLELEGFDAEIGGRKGDKNLQGGETELCARMHSEYGQGVMYNPEAEVAHKVFEYRTEPAWLLDRAFWQGYSKRAMEKLVEAGNGAEDEFLKQLLFDFIPGRLRRLLRSPSVANIQQLCMCVVLTGTVGVGYLYGMVKW